MEHGILNSQLSFSMNLLSELTIALTFENLHQRMGLRDESLFRALAGVVKSLPADDFDAQVCRLKEFLRNVT
jgi:hypothetical protein